MVDPPRDKRFSVSVIDSDGDIRAFETDSRERAEAMRSELAKDLQDVTLVDRTRLCGGIQEPYRWE